jgi:signal peptidase II
MHPDSQKKNQLLLWITVAAVLIVVDQITKWWILKNFQLGDSWTITSFFNLVRVHNPGAAFSFLADESGWQRYFFIAVGLAATAFIFWLLRQHGQQRLFAWSLTLIMGGALGNVLDRALHGYVVDFIQLHAYDWYFPSFNVADSCITAGAIGLILDELIRVLRVR